MALSSGVWAPVFPSPALQQGSGSGCGTVLMSVRVSVSRAALRTLRSLRSPGVCEDDAALRLQLSMDPNRPGDFRLTLRDSGSNGRIMVGLLALAALITQRQALLRNTVTLDLPSETKSSPDH